MFSTGWSHTQELIQDPKDYQGDLVDTLNEFSALLETAKAEVSDLEARYEAAAQAEAFLIEHALVMPLHRRISWQLTHVNDYTKAYAAYGVVADKFKNVDAYVDACTTADYEEYAATDYEAK
jgi:oligopeptide transport system substrate-binding protein